MLTLSPPSDILIFQKVIGGLQAQGDQRGLRPTRVPECPGPESHGTAERPSTLDKNCLWAGVPVPERWASHKVLPFGVLGASAPPWFPAQNFQGPLLFSL